MTEFGIAYSTVLAYGTVFMLPVLFFLFVFTLRFWKQKENPPALLSFISRHALLLSFLGALSSLFGSLIYSEIVGIPPCLLCWYQRILLYPQVALFGIALLRKDTTVFYYALPLTVIGFLIGAVQYTQQMLQKELVACGTGEVSCSIRYVFEFNFVTIPFMSLTLMTGLLLIGAIALRFKN
ncbi:MAG: disulfide bond formation protein B [Candidatus Paceibacterota bacterium]